MPESISLLYELHDALDEWKILREQKKSIKRIPIYFSDMAQRKEESSIYSKVDKMKTVLEKLEKEAEGLHPPEFLLDRFTFYKYGRPPSSDIAKFDEHEQKMVDWLSASSDGKYKAVGIYGMGGSGKTTFVKQVFARPEFYKKFKGNIIWAYLSDLTRKDEDKETTNTLVEELRSRLQKLGNYAIVFDDVWHCDEWFAELCHGIAVWEEDRGGVVVVTSRIKKVVKQIVGERNTLIQLSPWSWQHYHKDSNHTFVQHIVHQTRNELLDEQKNVVQRAGHELPDDEKYIISHCHGLALASKELPRTWKPTSN
ncbi:probable disease resistance protein RF45 [Prosopis cineraria]|uniref:probable disease resistance protein RF45 n=1 Tax=Prosopis cineraria TaxID=364024 RepID=UPI00240FB281|nr:probable disease resistance protein RF45 [Prosopis cineraria]